MARHPTSRRVKRDAHADEDAFIAKVMETVGWAKANSRRLTIAAVVLIIATLSLLYYRNQSTRLRDRAETELSQVRTAALAGNTALAIRDLEAYLARFGGTAAAPEARLLLGKAYIETGNTQGAIDLLRDQAADVGDPMGVAAAMLLAAAYEAAGQPDEAVATYLQVADGAEMEYERATALEAAARLRFSQGDAEEAVTLYDRILGILPEDSPDRAIIEMRRAEATARG